MNDQKEGSKYRLYGQRLIENDSTLDAFTRSLIKGLPRTETIEELVDDIKECLEYDLSRTDIDYQSLLCKYRAELGYVLYEADNYDFDLGKIEFFDAESAKRSFNKIVLFYARHIVLRTQTLDEAIEHSEDIAAETPLCDKCRTKHDQIAQWLIELKTQRERNGRSSDLDTKATKIVEEIILDIEDRRGIGHEWYQIDKDIQEEIKEVWFNIVKENMNS